MKVYRNTTFKLILPITTRATGTYDVAVNPPEKSAAHAQRAGAPKGNFVLPHATRETMGQGVKNPLQNRGKPVYSAASETLAPVAQLDRASVYGTEG